MLDYLNTVDGPYKTTDCKHVIVLWNTEDERRHIRYLREDTALACYLQRALYLGSSRVMSNILGTCSSRATIQVLGQ